MGRAFAPGEQLSDQVVVEQLIFLGGGGLSYKATSLATGQPVFVKQLKADFGSPEGVIAYKRFQRELGIGLESEHIPKVFGSFEHEGVHFLMTQFIEGQNLRQKLATRSDPLSSAETRNILRQAAQGLTVAHGHSVVHRDIKLDNIMLSNDGLVSLVDWGLCAFLDEGTIHDSRDPKGTIHFMSPEHVKACGVDRQSDLYGLGVVAYVCLTLRYPFDGEAPCEIFEKILNASPIPPREFNPAIDGRLDAIVLKLMEKEKTKRFADAHELIRELDRDPSDTEKTCSKCGVTVTGGTTLCEKCASPAVEPEAPYLGYLALLNGSNKGKRLTIRPEGVELGRWNLCIEDEFISRRHARIYFVDGQYWIEDSGSLNGTSVNARRLTIGKPHPLAPGDHIRFADTFFEFVR